LNIKQQKPLNHETLDVGSLYLFIRKCALINSAKRRKRKKKPPPPKWSRKQRIFAEHVNSVTEMLGCHIPISAQFQKGLCCMGIKIFNHLPTNIKSRLNDLRSFKLQLTTIKIAQFLLYK
jgi:hypothetical protein